MVIKQQVLNEISEISHGLPLIITLISKIYIDDKNEYYEIIKTMKESSAVANKIATLSPKMEAIITLIINRLNSDIKEKLIKLSVFKRVPIPVTMIMLLWRKPLSVALTILTELQSKYLLTIHNKDQNR